MSPQRGTLPPSVRRANTGVAAPPPRMPTLGEERAELQRQLKEVKASQEPLSKIETSIDRVSYKMSALKAELRTGMVVPFEHFVLLRCLIFSD